MRVVAQRGCQRLPSTSFERLVAAPTWMTVRPGKRSSVARTAAGEEEPSSPKMMGMASVPRITRVASPTSRVEASLDSAWEVRFP